jgi:Icc-related predicted phosphoesterase
MEILCIACIHNDVENILGLTDKLHEFKFDAIVFPGDFTDAALPKGFTREDVARLILSELKTFKKPVVTVPGTWDKDIIEMLEKSGTSVHGKGRIIDGVGFYGFGGAHTPFGTPYEPSEDEIEAGITRSHGSVKGAKFTVQVTHAPPINTSLDMIFSGAHVGSAAVRKTIETLKPTAAICAHIHEAKGADTVGGTRVVNPGRFPEGSCAMLSVKEGSVGAKMLSLI